MSSKFNFPIEKRYFIKQLPRVSIKVLFIISIFLFNPNSALPKTLCFSFPTEDHSKEVEKLKLELDHLRDQLRLLKPPFIMPENMKICDMFIDFNDPFIYRRVKKEINEIVFKEGMLGNLIDFSGEFFPAIEPILARYDIPDDLKYLVAVESNFKIHAASYAGAKGPWQFIKSSAKRFGLKYNSDYDERYNLTLATEAAAKHLLESYRVFGDWLLAITAYNKGTRGVNNILNIQGIDLSAANGPEKQTSTNNQENLIETGESNLETYMAEQRDSNFWDLVLLVKIRRKGRVIGYRDEQERYVPRVCAMKLILENVFDYDLLKFDPDNRFKPIPTDTVIASHAMSSLDVAKTLGISLWNLKYLNPQYKGLYPIFPKGKNFLLPQGMKDIYEKKKETIKKYISYSSSRSSSKSKREPFSKGDPLPDSVTLRSGETLWDIAQHFGISMKTLLRLNSITYQSARFLRPGIRIRLK